MATQEVVVDQRPIDLAPVDPSVKIPDHVQRAAALADSYYAKPAEPAAEAPAPVEAAPEPAPVAEVAPEQTPPVAPPAPQSDYTAPAPKEAVHDSEWAARYNSMRGRWEAAQRTIGSMQEQMSQLGDELVRTQALLRNQAPEQQQPQNNERLITPDDEQAYGPELLDTMRRAARESVGPEIEALRNENQSLKQRVTLTAQGEVKQALENEVPNWKAINKSPEFIQWLSLRNIYTGQVRKQMLNAAYSAADAPKVIAFFKDFLREGVATGQVPAVAQREQPTPAPRTAAVPLETLAAPGRARPASGEFSAPADKPIYTRAQVARFYDDVRRGAYAGRETVKAQHEQSIFSAQAEGRVR